MKIVYLDCSTGISGDMFLGAMIDLGFEIRLLRDAARRMGAGELSMDAQVQAEHGFRATRFSVSPPGSSPARNLEEIERMISGAGLPAGAASGATRCFRLLAGAEAAVHGVDINEVHFHEVGAIDSIVDIVGASLAIHALGITALFASPLPLGSGTIDCEHGALPVPAPAVVELLRGVPVYGGGFRTEVVTPTGAAILMANDTSFGEIPPMRIEKNGCGAGSREIGRPNILRAILGEPYRQPPCAQAGAVLLSTNIDDMNPEHCEHLVGRLLKSGAHDAWLTPIIMKRSRPAVELSVLCSPDDEARLSRILFRESTTFGIRRSNVVKNALERELVPVETPWGTVSVKLGFLEGEVITVSPEYSDCASAAGKGGVALKEVYRVAAGLAWDRVDKL